jgi:PAS domain S-box-containing protein
MGPTQIPQTLRVVLPKTDLAGLEILNDPQIAFPQTVEFIPVDRDQELRQLLASPPDLALAGIDSAPFTAASLLDIVRAHGLDLPVVVLYNASQEDAAEALLARGAADILPAANPVRLIPILNRELRLKQARFERQKAQESAAEIETRFQLIANNTGDVVWMVNADTLRFEFVTPSIFRLRGYSPEEILDLTVLDMVPAEVAPILYAGYQVRMKAFYEGDMSRRIQVDEVEQLRKDGSMYSAEQVTSLVTDSRGKVTHILGVSRDVSQRRETERKLRESESRYSTRATELQAVLDATPAIVWMSLDPECQNLMGNRYACKLYNLPEGTNFSLSPTNAAGRLGHRYFHNGVEIPENELPMQLAVRTGLPQTDVAMDVAIAGGAEFSLFGNAVPIFDQDGCPVGSVGVFFDITGRKRAEQAQRRSEVKFRAVIENNQDGILFCDPHGRVSYCSPSYREISGCRDGMCRDKSLFDQVLPDDLDMVHRYWTQVVTQPDKSLKLAYRIQDQAGARHWVETTAVNLINNPDVAEIIINIRDITEQKQVEGALVQSERKYRSLFTEMMSGCALHELVYDAQGNPVDYVTVEANPAFMTMLDVTPETAIGIKTSQILPPDELKQWLGIFGPVAAGGPGVSYEIFSPLNGKYFSGAAFSSEKGKFAVTFTDITDYRLAEKALRESEDRFRTLIEKAPQAIIITRGGKLIYANPLFLKIMGYPDEETCMQVPLAENYAPSERAASRERIQRRRLSLDVPDEFDTVAIRRDGTEFPIHFSMTQVRLTDGPAFMCFISDITAQKKAEAEIRHQAVNASALAELTSRLSTARDIDEVMEVVCQALHSVLEFPACAVYLLDEKNDILFPAKNHGIDLAVWEKLPPLVVSQGSGVELPVQLISPSDQERAGFAGLELYSMIYQGQLVGAVAIPTGLRQSQENSKDLVLIESFARQAAIPLINLRLYAETRDRASELEKLTEVSACLRQARTLVQMIPLLVRQTIQALNADTGALILFGDPAPHDPSEPGLPLPGPEWRPLLARLDLEKINQQDRTIFTTGLDRAEVPWMPGIPWQATSIVSFTAAVVKSAESTIGLLLIGYDQPHQPREDEEHLMLAIADMAGNAIQRTSMMDTLEQRVQVRTRELKVLFEIARSASQPSELKTILDQSLEQVMEIYLVQFGVIQLLAEDGETLELVAQKGLSEVSARSMTFTPVKDSIVGQVIAENRAVLSLDMHMVPGRPDPNLSPMPRIYLGAPIRAKGKILGVISISDPGEIQFSVEEVALLETIASQIGASVESARLRKRSKEAAILEERQRLARDLHDSVTQSLFSLNMMAEGCRLSAAQASQAQIVQWFAELGASAQQALKDMRLLLYELRPSTIEHDGLVTALHRRLDAVEGRSGVKSRFLVEGDPRRLSILEEHELYHLAQEALNNALKHAQATVIDVRLMVGTRLIKLEIRDDGIGFEPDRIESEGMGLASMAERAKRMGGSLEVLSQLGRGTTIKYQKGASHG